MVRKDDPKQILSPFGLLTCERRYCRSKESREYRYLVEEKVGIKPHARVGVNIKADLAQASATNSYKEATLQVNRYNEDQGQLSRR